MLDRFRERRDASVELNLTPIMNLFVAMIPFLLMCTSFYTVSVVNASVPTPSEAGESDLAVGDDKITLAVQIRRGVGYKVTAQSDTLPEAQLDKISTEVEMQAGAFDTAALAALALDVKTRYPKSDTAILLPEREIFYDDLVQTMDALRERVRGEGPTEVRELLFPVVVVSTIATAPEPAPDAPEPAATP